MHTMLHLQFARPLSAISLAATLCMPIFSPAFAQEDQGIADLASADAPPAFAQPDAAVTALKDVLADDNVEGLARLLGLDSAKLKADRDAMKTYEALREKADALIAVEEEGDRRLLDIGIDLWPFPFPIVRAEDGQWSFDTFAGLEEIVNRRVGLNELEAIGTARAYLDAQNEYAAQDRDGDGVLEFAQGLVSAAGQMDGLYWTPRVGIGASPAGELMNQAAFDAAGTGDGYFGYHFRILTRQGDNIAGGAYDYLINGNMIGGYAMLAWPVTYAETGIHTFVVSHHGVVYEADLGPATSEIASYIDSFDPDEKWSVVND